MLLEMGGRGSEKKSRENLGWQDSIGGDGREVGVPFIEEAKIRSVLTSDCSTH